ncbi:MAG TPA: glutathione S-transferase family protein [Gammaproteobacteria bacterium]
MYSLYYSPGAASMAVHLMLLELGVPHELRRLDLDARQQKSADYLRLNPNGLVPTLIIDGTPHCECAALLMLLAERHPEANLAPPPGAGQRATYLQWMVNFANTLQPAFRQWFYPLEHGPAGHEAEIKQLASKKVETAWDRLAAHLDAGGPYVLGREFGLIDLYATMLMRWSRNMPKPATAWPQLKTLADRIKARPSWKRLYEIEALTEWM